MDQTRSVLGKRKADQSQNDESNRNLSETRDMALSLPMHDQGLPSALSDDTTDERIAESLELKMMPVISLDGTGERWSRVARRSPVSAIFIHAGAGYHSTNNEQIHLKACSEAAQAGMRALRAGHSALDAVEAAIKILEDKEITNAGYGSNLAIDGTVECDATIVDHLGRSGAVGAVSNVKNPISLARVILEKSSKPLSLRRVPPNLLVGEGAKDFAWENGIPIVPNEWLVSRNARDRFLRWQEDLKRAEARENTTPTPTTSSGGKPSAVGSCEHNSQPTVPGDHAKAILTGTWNEGQPDSPAPGTPSGGVSPLGTPSPKAQNSPLPSPNRVLERNPLSLLGASLSSLKTAHRETSLSGAKRDGHHGGDASYDVDEHIYEADGGSVPGITQDNITDTVGAIAIDQDGRIAAASSSGGIGMKHRGRVGPAALVGIGTAVIPQDRDDPDLISVAAVTSGTGEHMATTIASQKCAERIYQWTKRGKGGADVPEEDESVILESFILKDFQNHLGVKNSSSAGAIGVMAVKKGPSGFYLYFGHNTDSFALASMASTDREPLCVMSRLNEGNVGGVSQGARKIRLK